MSRLEKNIEYKIIKILCEDKKSFQIYLSYMCKEFGFAGNKKFGFISRGRNKYKILIEYIGKTDPLSIVEQAKKEIKKCYKIYCVFDYDGHVVGRRDNYKKAMQDETENIIKINSVICYEIWLLLHLKQTSKVFNIPREIEKEFEKEIQKNSKYKNFKYDKSDFVGKGFSEKARLFDFLYDRLENAKKNYHILDEDNQKTDSDNPSTKIPLLLKDLENYVDC